MVDRETALFLARSELYRAERYLAACQLRPFDVDDIADARADLEAARRALADLEATFITTEKTEGARLPILSNAPDISGKEAHNARA
jgi:hypothetical protein